MDSQKESSTNKTAQKSFIEKVEQDNLIYSKKKHKYVPAAEAREEKRTGERKMNR
ncbi:MAG: hypothetical protein GF401_09490 [Chitinivibrionales bacterium]|nr:hypothetical protein [Chitinivibrionales bacterium]